MASSPASERNSTARPAPRPNTAFRRLRGRLSPGEFAASVRRAARDIGERVSCDARYIGRVESGEIRCPNYAYERVFRHMFPGRSLSDLGFAPRAQVRGRASRSCTGPQETPGTLPEPQDHRSADTYEESDVLRRVFMAGGAATAATLGSGPALPPGSIRSSRPVGAAEAAAVEEAVRSIRLLDDRHGADGLYRQAVQPLRAAYALLDAGAQRRSTSDRLHAGTGELAISVGWLAHDSGRFDDARSHYAEALATARMAGDAGLEAHAFCNTAFLARDAGRPREAVRAAQAAQVAAGQLSSSRLLSLLAMREAGGWAAMGDRSGCETALLRAQTLYARGPADADPEWMSFYGEAELEGLEAQCWSALGHWERAAHHARRAAELQDPHFVRNTALFTAELAGDLARQGAVEEAAEAGDRVLDLLDGVRSARIRGMLDTTAGVLAPTRRVPAVAAFLDRRTAGAAAA
ncbi:hypothetical protein [Streptomyces meridianus]|uniref:Tetratricopeptide repeat protein n=1 Tax=Streptomyces meridianus TaxID=2938945 RepID=A0ABT0WZZ9_9ACTN|nr:hypothetical protein [Streptomyces meridianus]MCM2575896.1 hypothetical protein [Streptomyces meridianus]